MGCDGRAAAGICDRLWMSPACTAGSPSESTDADRNLGLQTVQVTDIPVSLLISCVL